MRHDRTSSWSLGLGGRERRDSSALRAAAEGSSCPPSWRYWANKEGRDVDLGVLEAYDLAMGVVRGDKGQGLLRRKGVLASRRVRAGEKEERAGRGIMGHSLSFHCV